MVAENAAILAMQIMAVGDKEMMQKVVSFKSTLKEKIEKANQDFSKISFSYKTN